MRDFTEMLKEFVMNRKRKRELAALTKDNQEKLKSLEESIMRNFEQKGIRTINIDNETVFIKREIYAGFIQDEDQKSFAIEALKNAGLADLCPETISKSNLNSYCRELHERNESLPSALQDIFKINEIFKISSKKTS